MALLGATIAAGASATEHREHGAHVHGHGQLNLVLEGNRLDVELIVPGVDVVGFEHAPSDDRQQAAVNAAIATLRDPDKIFALPAAAACVPDRVEVESTMLEATHDREEHAENHDKEEHDDEDGHAEFHATYSFRCGDPNSLDEFALRYFEHFKGTAELEVQPVGPWGQTAGELTPESRRMRF